MTGAVPFVYISTCGCVFSQAGLKTLTSTSPSTSSPSPPLESEREQGKDVGEKEKQLDVCPQCAKKFDRSEDVRIINPSREEEEKMRIAMEARRIVEASAKSAKSKSKKRKVATNNTTDSPDTTSLEPPKKKAAKEDRERERERERESRPIANVNVASINGVGSTSRAVASSLAMEEAKRKAGMSEAVRSLYGPKDGVKRKETFMTMGTFTRVSGSFLTLRIMRGFDADNRLSVL